MVVFVAETQVDVRIAKRGKPGEAVSGQTDLRFVVTVPQSAAEQYVTEDGQHKRAVFTRAAAAAAQAAAAQAAAAAAAAVPTAGTAAGTTSAPGTATTPVPRPPLTVQPPERVTVSGQIGRSDAVTALPDGQAVMSAIRGALADTYGDHWPQVELPLDPATRQKPVPAQHYALPPRIAQSLLLSGTDIVLDVRPLTPPAPVSQPAIVAQPATVPQPQATTPAATQTVPVTRAPGGQLATAAVLDQLDATGEHVFGSPAGWAAAKRKLRKKFDAAALQPRMRSLMAGQPWVIQLKGGSVTVTASVQQLTHQANTEATEFNTGSTSVVAAAGSDGRTADTASTTHTTSVQAVGTSDPLTIAPVAVVAGGTITHTSAKDQTAENLTSGRTGLGTKTKVPGSVFDGIAQLHFEFRRPWRPWGQAVDQRIPVETGQVQHQLDWLQGQIDLLSAEPVTEPAQPAATRAPAPSVPLLVSPDLITGRLEAVAWQSPTPEGLPHPQDGRALGLLRYRIGDLDPAELGADHPVTPLPAGTADRHGGGRPPRVPHVASVLADEGEGRAQQIVDALFHRAAKVALSENADHLLVSTNGTEADAAQLRPLGLRPLDPDQRLWHSTTADLQQALRSRPAPPDLKVGNCESRRPPPHPSTPALRHPTTAVRAPAAPVPGAAGTRRRGRPRRAAARGRAPWCGRC
ncbi:hypothetical protein [Kitasatospora sp. NBC_01266]|uniref:hypothetical protein n=1 Tax=Kitasatospora sp. NBC_01266 TaxID=2903572 RepID=UPI002E368366|nr:hypothetical protein [Kitasatospora sp. NBC_01266]